MTKIGRFVVPAALLGLLTLVPTHASAAASVPFKATVSESYTLSVCGQYSRCITVVGTGLASHLGAVTEASTVRIDINQDDIVNGCAPEIRSTTLVAANGDTLTMRATGWTCFATNTAYDTYLVTGGTGRFEDAFGGGSDTNVHMLTGPGVGIAWVDFTGRLSY